MLSMSEDCRAWIEVQQEVCPHLPTFNFRWPPPPTPNQPWHLILDSLQYNSFPIQHPLTFNFFQILGKYNYKCLWFFCFCFGWKGVGWGGGRFTEFWCQLQIFIYWTTYQSMEVFQKDVPGLEVVALGSFLLRLRFDIYSLLILPQAKWLSVVIYEN